MKAIVGSSDLWPTPSVASLLLSLIAATDEEIAIRAKADGEPSSMVEDLTERICERVGRPIRKYQVDPRVGSSSGWIRDNELVEASTTIYALYAPGKVGQGGTGHIVESAWFRHKSVTAWESDEEGNLTEIGDHHEDERFR